MPRWYKPLQKDHPLVNNPEHKCPVCRQEFKEGDVVGLIPVQAHGTEGPKDRTVEAIPVHKKCYYPRETVG